MEKEIIEIIIDDAFEAGAQYEYEMHFGQIPTIAPNKEQYILKVSPTIEHNKESEAVEFLSLWWITVM